MYVIIIQEGQDDNALYLLREGNVAVKRGRVTQVTTIDAVNFFGEMALIRKDRQRFSEKMKNLAEQSPPGAEAPADDMKALRAAD